MTDHDTRQLPATKRCCACRRRRRRSQFAHKDRARGTLQSRCRDCQAAASRAHYEAHAARVKARSAERNRQVRAHQRHLVATARNAARCTDCGCRHTPRTPLAFTNADGAPSRVTDLLRIAGSDEVLLAAVDAAVPLCAACSGARRSARLRVDRAELAAGPHPGMALGDALAAATITAGRALTASELHTALTAAGIDTAVDTVRTTLARELRAGRVERPSRGRYVAATS